MTIEFYKSKEGQIILTITRDNGTRSWSKLFHGTEDHDLAHYAVEQTLNMSKGFFGLINEGQDISDFADKEILSVIEEEALQSEYLVNLLQTEYWNAKNELDIITMLQDVLQLNGLPMIKGLNHSVLSEIRNSYHVQIPKLKGLGIGEKLELKFQLPSKN